jgi:hypothetical protein
VGLAGTATETLGWCDAGRCTAADGRSWDFGDALRAAVAATRVHAPPEVEALAQRPRVPPRGDPGRRDPRGHRERRSSVARRGRRRRRRPQLRVGAQRGRGASSAGPAPRRRSCAAPPGCTAASSRAPAYYAANRAQRTALYTDCAITSPRVPFFRGPAREVVEPCLLSVVTSPAPNTGALRQQGDADGLAALPATFRRRALHVLGLLEELGCDAIVLGAWGCGAFQGDPALVADAFALGLAGPFAGRFRRVVFGVWGRGGPRRAERGGVRAAVRRGVRWGDRRRGTVASARRSGPPLAGTPSRGRRRPQDGAARRGGESRRGRVPRRTVRRRHDRRRSTFERGERVAPEGASRRPAVAGRAGARTPHRLSSPDWAASRAAIRPCGASAAARHRAPSGVAHARSVLRTGLRPPAGRPDAGLTRSARSNVLRRRSCLRSPTESRLRLPGALAPNRLYGRGRPAGSSGTHRPARRAVVGFGARRQRLRQRRGRLSLPHGGRGAQPARAVSRVGAGHRATSYVVPWLTKAVRTRSNRSATCRSALPAVWPLARHPRR